VLTEFDGKRQKRKQPSSKPTGRRDLSASSLPQVDVEITDPELEGVAERIGVEVSWMLGYERGGQRRIRISRVVYKVPGTDAEAESPCIVTAPAPQKLLRRSFLAPSLVAYILVAKYMMGTPFYRLEQLMELQGESLDRGTMCRVAEDVGATLGAIVLAARDEAMATAFCLSTDATGVAIQPTPLADGRRQPCRKGHFFVILADCDHVFFEYQPRHTSAAVCEMFKGFRGYIQADAHAVFDALFRGPPHPTLWDEATGPPPTEVGCWSHCRRNFWDAAVCKHQVGIEGLRRIDAMFAADARLAKLPPSRRKVERQKTVRPLVEGFFQWVEEQHALVRVRDLVSKALGYAHRQQVPLQRFLDDGRLRMDNNRSERALRSIATGRNAWLFFGSDDHAEAAANLFSLVASCKLHGLDPEAYLRDVIHVMPYWPRDRYLELCPKYWLRTRSRLDPAELSRPIGFITVPPSAAEQQHAAN
jgi:transposase